ncbi:MAG: DPP IV N-terminal domain-containing protein [Pirellulaceae bacterium]
MMLRLLVGVCVGVLSVSGSLFAQSIEMDDLPGWERFQEATAAMAAMPRNVPANLEWSADDGKLFFSLRGQGRQQVDLATGEISEAENEPGDDDGSAARRRPRRAGVGRARQRTWIKSADEQWKASYRDFNLVLERLNDQGEPEGEPIQVTTDGSEKHRFGTACWVYGEELSQQDAMWFSPESDKLAFYEIDESHMKTYFLTTRNTQVYTGLHNEQYPTAGQDNPHVKLHIYDVESGQTVQVKVDGPVDQYIYGIRFSPDGKELIFHRTNRWQNELDVMAADVDSGSVRTVVAEKQETWQDNSPTMQFLDDGQRFIWETERTGWKQYELRHMQGHKICDLTPEADYPVHQIVKVDEEAGWVYYSAFSGDNPLNLQLHRSQIDGSESRRLTTESAHHSNFQISPDHAWFVASHEDVNSPAATAVYNMSGDKIATLFEPHENALAEAGFTPGELFSFPSADGQATIYGTLYKPRNFDPSKKYPLLIDVYGGPASVGVTNRFRATNPYCELGFVIARIGNRGTVNRGKEFESANYLQLGVVDMDDQAEGVRYLAQRDYIDGDRVGISGHSYGGYLSALALLRYPEVFHVGVAGAPVTDWKNYDTIYTERYMRTPAENREGYGAGSCLRHADKLVGKLFILHGLVDDNVHPSNTWQLVDALQKAGKRFDMMVYPNSAHGFGYNELKWEYFIRHLKPDLGDSSDP